MANKILPIQGFVRKALEQCRDQQASDRDLLHRFVERRDESAFAALVRRHSAMVLGVGLRVLGHQQDAEDVCQATFLRLAQKAGAVPWRESIANWLYGTAYRFCLQARDAGQRRRVRENKIKPKPPPDALAEIALRELQAVLDEELARLPRKYSAPLLLCCLEGKARDEAAQCLGWPLATVKSRLEDGRELLRRRLARRGLALSVVFAGVAFTSAPARAALSALLVRATSGAALQVLGGHTASGMVSANVLALVKGAAHTAFLTKLKLAVTLLLMVSAIAGGVIALVPQAPAEARPDAPAPPVAQAAVPRGQANDPLPAGALMRLGTTRWRHGGRTGFVAFLPDGRGVVSASEDRVFHLWELPSGQEIRRFGPGLDAPVPLPARLPRTELPVALSADGKTVACDFDGTEILLYDVATGEKAATLGRPRNRAENPGALCSVAFSPDGRRVARRNWLGEITIWDWKTGRIQNIAVRHRFIIGETPAVTYAPDGTLLAMTVNEPGFTSTIALVDPSKDAGKQVRTVRTDPPAHVTGVLFSPNSKVLAWTGGSGVVNLLDVATGKQIHEIRGPERGGVAMAFSRDGKSIFTRSYARRPVREWDVATGKELRSFSPPSTEESSANDYGLPRPAMSPDGTILAFAGVDHALHFLDLRGAKEVHAQHGSTRPVSALGFAPDDKRLWMQGSGRSLRQWEWAIGNELSPIRLPINTFNAAVSGDGRYIAKPPTDSKPGQIIRVADGKRVGKIPPRRQLSEDDSYGPANMVVSPDGKLLAMRWQATQEIDIYAMPDGKLLHKHSIVAPEANTMAFSSWTGMAFSSDGGLLAAYSAPRVLSFWDTLTGQKRGSLPVQGSLPLDGIAFAPDGRTLALENDAAGSVVLLELVSGKQRRIFRPNDVDRRKTGSPLMPGESFAYYGPFAAPPANVAFSPKGKLLLLGSPDGVIHVWNVHSGVELAALRGHTGVITAFAFAADGKTLASASADTTVLTWDLSPWASRPIPPRVLTDAELQTRWAILAGADAEKAFAAICDLASAPVQAVRFLNARLRPAPMVDVEKVKRQLADLRHSEFKVRERAIADLIQQGTRVVPLIEKALASGPPLEVRLRLQKIRGQLTAFLLNGEDLRQFRALEVLESSGTPAARRLLDQLAGGAPGALMTTNARAAVKRIMK